MNKFDEKFNDLKNEYINFFLSFKSLELSTIGKNNQPQTSYAPFVSDDKKNFFIYISSLATHTKNLLNNKKAGVMLIESEEKAENIFIRRRVIFECEVIIIPKNIEEWEKTMNNFDYTFGEIMKTLRMLSDFKLFKLKPKSGRFIKGFGNAYKISGDKMDELLHLNPKKT